MSDLYGPLYFEKILVKLLFLKKEIRNTVIPYLKPELFNDIHVKSIIEEIVKFNSTFNKFPTPHDLLLNIKSESTRDAFSDLKNLKLDIFSEENVIQKVESFFQKQLVNDELDKATELLVKGDIHLIDPQKLLEAKSFSFDNEIGLELLADDGSEFYDYLHDEAQFIPSGLKIFDQMMCGGFRRKALTMFLAGTNCFDGEEEIEIYIDDEIELKSPYIVSGD